MKIFIRRQQKFTHYLSDTNRFDVSSKGPSLGITLIIHVFRFQVAPRTLHRRIAIWFPKLWSMFLDGNFVIHEIAICLYVTILQKLVFLHNLNY